MLTNPLLRTTAVGFLVGASIPVLFAQFYYMPLRTQNQTSDINFLKKVVNFLNWQVWKMEQANSMTNASSGNVVEDPIDHRRYLTSDKYRDGLYWAGF